MYKRQEDNASFTFALFMASSRTVNSSKEPETSNGAIDSLSLDDADDGNGKVFSNEGFPGKRT